MNYEDKTDAMIETLFKLKIPPGEPQDEKHDLTRRILNRFSTEIELGRMNEYRVYDLVDNFMNLNNEYEDNESTQALTISLARLLSNDKRFVQLIFDKDIIKKLSEHKINLSEDWVLGFEISYGTPEGIWEALFEYPEQIAGCAQLYLQEDCIDKTCDLSNILDVFRFSDPVIRDQFEFDERFAKFFSNEEIDRYLQLDCFHSDKQLRKFNEVVRSEKDFRILSQITPNVIIQAEISVEQPLEKNKKRRLKI